MKPDIKLAVDAIKVKQPGLTKAFNYYDGDHPLVFSNERLRSVFSGEQVKFTENWCGVVVDSMKERINLSGFTLPAGLEETGRQLWDVNTLALESDDLHEAFLVTGEAFLIVWPSEFKEVEMFYNDPRLCHVFYESSNPRQMRCAAKMWQEDDGHYKLTLYYPERIEYYRTTGKVDVDLAAEAFASDESVEGGVAKNPYDQIPVFHFRLKKRVLQGELTNVIPVQNGINKLLTDMMVAAEFGAFRQRWIISNADVSRLKNSPNEIWSIPAGDGIGQATQLGEFSPTDLQNYLKAIEQLAADIAKTTRTPKHYLFSQGGDPSGEALIAMEAPLNRKVRDRIERLTPVWKQAMAFALSLSGKTVQTQDITPVFDIVETVQPKTNAEIRVLNTQAGIPIKTVLKREGWTDQELVDMDNDQESSGADLGNKILNSFEKGQ